MIKDLETIGLKVEEIVPGQNEVGVKLDKAITVKFNAFVNKTTVVNNIILTNCNTEERIPCTIKVHDDIVELKPKNILTNKERYKVSIPKFGVADVLGRKLIVDFECYFTTEIGEYTIKPKILEPKNSIYTTIPQIVFTTSREVNFIEFSNTKNFNLITYSKLLTCETGVEIKHKLETNLTDGLYYVRIRTDNDVYSEVAQFYLTTGEGKVSDEDYAEEVDNLYIKEEIEQLSFKPSKVVEVGLNRKYIYYTFNGKIDTDLIDKCKHYIFGESVDSTNEEIVEHSYVDYNLIYMYDCVENITYIIFELIEGDADEKDTNSRV